MSKEIVINVRMHEKRIGVIENGKLEEFMVERPDHERLVGNIYLGIVQNVQPTMQAAFIDIGFEKSAFLAVSDFEPGSLLSDNQETASRQNSYHSIEHLLRRGDRILVQVIKEPIGTKGAKVSMQISLAGRFVVLLSGTNFVGVSKRTDSGAERNQVRRFIESVKPEGVGIIVRTIGLLASENDFQKEIQILYEKYCTVLSLACKQKETRLIYKEMGLAASAIRDLFTPDVSKVIVDSKYEYKEILTYLKTVDPAMRERVFLYKSDISLFDEYGIEKEVDKILRRKVWLKSGGYLIFDFTEALVAIDVNTGKYSGKGKQEEAIFRTNLDAAYEAARQIRLRDMGGLVIIDFIDMENPVHQHRVWQAFYESMKRDKATHHIAKISEFGLVEMSRKRVRPQVVQMMSEVCPTCGGVGTVFSSATLIARIDRCLQRYKTVGDEKKLQLEVTYELGEYLQRHDGEALNRLMKENNLKIELFANDEYHNDEFRIYSAKTGEDITEHLLS
jgi:ribonuclease G